jgi:hypothetical protein
VKVARAAAVLVALSTSVASVPAWGDEPAPKAKAKKAAPATEDEEPNPDEEAIRYPPSSVRLPLVVGGAAVTLIAYGLTLASALSWDDVPGADMMLVPIAGPWIALGESGCAEDDPDCGAILYIRGALLVLSGIAQAAGLGLVGEGIFMTTEATTEEAPEASWTIAPMVTPTQGGVGFLGTF